MPENKNALAELAERLRKGLYINPNDKRFDGPVIVRTLEANDVRAAQRIVAELAKVVDCKEPERIMPLDEPYDDITIYAPYDNGLTESNSINEDEKRFILDLANVAWKCREIAEEEAK